MQYYSDKKQKNIGYLIIIAICLIGIAVASIVAGTNNKKDKDNSSSNDSNISEDNSSYTDSTNEDVTNYESEITENTVSDVPYEEKAKSEKKAFVMPITGNIIKGYSDTSLQYDKTYGDMRLHKAIDIACKENSQIVSATSGTVTEISESDNYLTSITIDHGDGLTVKYRGLGSACVKQGESVGAGVLIGTATNPPCECADECHIHIEAYINGEAVSPVSAFGF